MNYNDKFIRFVIDKRLLVEYCSYDAMIMSYWRSNKKALHINIYHTKDKDFKSASFISLNEKEFNSYMKLYRLEKIKKINEI